MFRLVLLCQSKTQVNRGPGYAYLNECLSKTNLACEQQTYFRSGEEKRRSEIRLLIAESTFIV